ncbi:hypothetical protein CDL12_24944 [Handroanthus impetiginosus]|uniref:Mitochondrial import inner membrane translocase subunit Tim21 n=1 Tax=Handroanthus impetiginosus TaxID=429701 RepID=A0A2G9GB67_9LAMI|nr:hypothetical protein CDL12_24944 [Handroanthus impetiginosus]
MNRIKRSGLTILLSSLRASSNAGVGFAGFSSLATERSVTTGDFFKMVLQHRDRHGLIHQSPFQLATSSGPNMRSCCFIRCLASNTTESNKKEESKTRIDMSTGEDPVDLNQAAFELVIFVGLAVVGAIVSVPVFIAATEHEAMNKSNVYKVFGKSLERVQNDSQVRDRIGSPIMGYVSGFPITSDGSELKNILRYRRIPNTTWMEYVTEHIVVKFHIRGPDGDGVAMSMMFKDKVDKQWKFKYLIVEFGSPTRAQFVLEELEGIRWIRTV